MRTQISKFNQEKISLDEAMKGKWHYGAFKLLSISLVSRVLPKMAAYLLYLLIPYLVIVFFAAKAGQ